MKKLLRKLFLISICCAILLWTIGCNNENDNGDKPKPYLSTGEINLRIGEKVTLSVYNYDGSVNWASTNESVAKVNGSGAVEGVYEGFAVITASVGDTTLSCRVNVFESAVGQPKLMLDRESATIMCNPSAYGLTLIPQIVSGHSMVSMSDITVNWSSSDTSVVTVSTQGKITGLNEGSATITASCDYEGKQLSASCEITVKIIESYTFFVQDNKPVEKLCVFADDPYLNVAGETNGVEITLKKFNLITNEEVALSNVQWSLDGQIVTIEENGSSVTVKPVSGITGSEVLRAAIGTETVELPVESWIKLTNKEQLDRLGLATWDLRAPENNDELERVLGGWYMLGGDIDYNDDYLIPIATNANGRNGSGYNVTYNLDIGMAGANSRYSHHSYTMFQILNEYYKVGGPNDKAENRLLQGTHRSTNKQIAIYYNDYTYTSGNNTTYFGLNYQGKAFTGILEGNGYSIKNAKLIEDIAAYQFTNATPAPATNVFGYCGTQFIGYNDGIVRNISFDNLRYTDSSLGDKFDKTNISVVGGYNVYAKVSTTSWNNASNAQGFLCTEFQTRAGLIQVNNGTVENIRITFTKDYRLHIYNSGFGIRVNNGTVNNLVMIQEGGAIVGNDDYYFTADNANGSLSNCFALILLGVDIQGATLQPAAGVIDNCNKAESVEAFTSAVASNPDLLADFDALVWTYNPSVSNSSVMEMKKGNYWNIS